jgi:mannan endo-1,4-beta-mannosidase
MMLTTALIVGSMLPAEAVRLEAQDAMRSGNVVLATGRAGHSGSGYLTGFTGAGDRAQWTFDSAGGPHRIVIRYSAAGEKRVDLELNHLGLSGTLPASRDAFADFDAGRVLLKPGENQLAVFGGWHHYDIDHIALVPTESPPPPEPPPATLVNPHASHASRQLMRYLVSQYGRGTLSGVIAGEERYVLDVTGKLPAVIAGDVMNYSTTALRFGADTKRETERMIEYHQRGHVVTLLWHWYAPADLYDDMRTNSRGEQVDARWGRSFYTNATSFDVARAMDDPSSEHHALILRDIDLVAEQLKRLDDAGVTVLWRPLHEAEGRWFWWGAKGPRPFRQLWDLMYDRLTHHHKLTNLIWVYTGGADAEWYPGDDKVDIIGVDAYPRDPADPLTRTWDELQKAYGGRKLVALTEIGGVPDAAVASEHGVHWS